MSAPSIYLDRFSPHIYLQEQYGRVTPLRHVLLAFLHKFYAEDIAVLLPPEKSEPRRRVLDMACGPVIINQLSAARWADEIVMADALSDCLDEVRRWKRADGGSFDWTPHSSLVAKMENMPTEDIENRLRHKISNIVHCNVQKDPPLDKELGNFDVIYIGYLLCACCEDDAKFKDVVKKILDRLNPGGIFISLEALEEKFFRLGENQLQSYSIRKDFFEEVLRENGLSVRPDLVSVPVDPKFHSVLTVAQKEKPSGQ